MITIAITRGMRAQHMTIGSPAWFRDGAVPDELPKNIKIYRPDYPADLPDLPLKPLSTKRPGFPKELLEKATTGNMVIEILIDEKGRAKLPRLIRASDPASGCAAVQAVATGWFQPHQSGKPVIAR